MRPRTLRARVVAAVALSILLAVVVLGAGVEVLVGRHLHRSLDRTLRDRAADVARLAVSAPALLTAPGALDSPLGGRELSVEVLDKQGRIVARSLALGGRLLPESGLVRRAIEQGRSGYGDATLANDRLRFYAAPLADLGGRAAGGAVVVATSTSELTETLDRLRDVLLLSAVAAAGLASLAAAFLLQRALRPLARLSAAAAEIERTGDATRRLPAPETTDEVGRLAETLNGMLRSLDRARDRERQFVADASHELRTPLTALRGNVAYVARHGASSGDEVVADLEEDSDRMAGLIDALLVLSREDAAGAPKEIVRLDELARLAGERNGPIDVVAPAPVLVRGDQEALERALANLVENARRYGPDGGLITVAAEQESGRARLSVTDEGPGLPPEAAQVAFERFWRGGRDTPGAGLGLAIVRAIAETRWDCVRRRLSRHAGLARSQRTLRVGRYNWGSRTRERIAVKLFRTLPTRRLLTLVAAVAAFGAAAGTVAVTALGGSGETPPPKLLAQALHDGLSAPEPGGITARVTFTNHLFPSGAIFGQAGSALMSGASGRLWVTNDGRGRIELQSEAGDAQIVWTGDKVTVYDASSNTVYRATLPGKGASSTGRTESPPSLDEISTWLAKLGKDATLSDAQPDNVAGQPAYTVRISPKHDGGLLGSAELAWDAARGVPLRFAIYAQGSSTPVLALTATDISYGPVSTSNVDVSPPTGAKVVDLGSHGPGQDASTSTPSVSGLDAVQASVSFPLVAPDSLVGLPRQTVQLLDNGDSKGALVVYGEGLGAIVVVERPAGVTGSSSQLDSLPKVSIGGVTGHELATQLGTAIEFQRAGVSFLLVGSLPPAAAEAAARALG